MAFVFKDLGEVLFVLEVSYGGEDGGRVGCSGGLGVVIVLFLLLL